MDIETDLSQLSPTDFTPENLKYRTPSTYSSGSERFGPSLLHSQTVSEFSFDSDINSLNKMMSHINLEEKENEKHCTDRFIPSRKHSNIDTTHPFSFVE
jgi:hypothetical protein